MPNLEVSKLRVTLGSRVIIRNASIDLGEGQVKVVTGPSGSGKTTLLRVIAGIIPNIIEGEVLGVINPDFNMRKNIIAYVPQEPWFSVATPYVWSEVTSFTNIRSPTKLEKLLKTYGLGNLSSRTTYTLSAGELQRLSILCSIETGKDIILLDEPLSHIDASNVEKVRQTIKLLKSEGYSIIAIDHNIEAWLGIADEFYILEEGYLKKIDPDSVINAINKLAEQLTPPLTKLNELVCSIENIKFRYPGSRKLVLNDLFLTVKKGEIVHVKGPSGCGKSTLLRLVAGMFKPTKGEIKRYGRIQYVPDNPLLYFTQPTPLKELNYNIELLKKYGLAHVANTPIKLLSVGERRRLSIISSLMKQADLILIDEPTVGLDPLNKSLVLRTIVNAAESGTSFIIASHDPWVSRIANNVLDLGGE